MSSKLFDNDGNNPKIYLKLDSVVGTATLQSIYDTLMVECWNDMSNILEDNAYIHCYLYYNDYDNKFFNFFNNISNELIRYLYNGVRGFDDPADEQDYLGKYMTVKEYTTGWMMTIYSGPENCKSGDDSFQNIYKFLPKPEVLLKYEDTISEIKKQVEIHCNATLDNLMYTLLPPNSYIDWHVDTGMSGRLHIVIQNDGTTPSMTFKKDSNSELEHIPATVGETYFANVSIPHTVEVSKSTRLHLLGCCGYTDNKPKYINGVKKEYSRHDNFTNNTNLTWAEWKRQLDV